MMPSGVEIEASGLPLSTAIKSLTLNTEENSLDIIELYKRVEKIELENSKLKKENQLLKKYLLWNGGQLSGEILKGVLKNLK